MRIINTYRLVLPGLLMLLVWSNQLSAQGNYLERAVIGSTGNTSFAPNAQVTVSSTVGETMVQTTSSSSYTLNQGFHQSNYVEADPFIIDFVSIMDETCIGAENGMLSISVAGCLPPYTINWSNGDTGTVISELGAGTYTVSVTGANNCQVQNTIDILVEQEVPCEIQIFTGITPNNDGQNDAWIIENIEFFPENTVSIHTRSGNKVWEANGYDNDFTIWTGTNQSGTELPNDTYWYVLETDGKTYRGWVEVTR